MPTNKFIKASVLVFCIVTWLTLLYHYVQFLYFYQSISLALINFFKYLTLISNTLVACAYTALITGGKSKIAVFFNKPNVLTAITIYIVLVGMAFNMGLRPLDTPGWVQWFTEEILHVINPFFFFFIWLIYVEKASLQYKDILYWLILPWIYLIVLFTQAALTNSFPYPFINFTQRVYLNAILHFSIVTGSIIAFGFIIVYLSRKNHKNA